MKKKKNTYCQSLPKWSKTELHSRYGLIKNLWQIHSRDSHMEFTEKLKSAIPREQNYVAWLVKNGKTVFSKLTWKIYLSVSGEQANRQASTWPGIFLSRNFRYQSLNCYFSEIYCNFCFKQMFNGFWTSNFDFYWSLALQFSCIMVRLSECRFLFAVASD